LTITPNDLPLGNSSRSNSSRLRISDTANSNAPVMLPPGRARLSTKPNATGSLPNVNTTGIVPAWLRAARTALVPPVATSTDTPRCASSAASAGSRS
jgi:hypothetical protein